MTDTGEAAGEIVSTHDLTKRSTSSGLRLISYNQRFNSRPHEEVDEELMHSSDGLDNVSTHDLTKRSTLIH